MSDFIYPELGPDGAPVGVPGSSSAVSIKANTPSSRTYKVGSNTAVKLPVFVATSEEPGNVVVTFTVTTGDATISDSATGTFLPDFNVSGTLEEVNEKLSEMHIKVDPAEQGTVSYMVEIDVDGTTAKAPELYQVLNDTLNDKGQTASATVTVSGSSGTIQIKVNDKPVSPAVSFTNTLANTVSALVEAINDYDNVPRYKASVIGGGQFKIEAPLGYGAAANDFTVSANATGTMSINGDAKLANGRDAVEAPLTWGDKFLKGTLSALPTIGAGLALGIGLRSLGKVEVEVSTTNGVPDVAVIYEGMLVPVPNNYEPGDQALDGTWNVLPSWDRFAWDGVTFTDKYTTNPAWCLYEFINNKRWGCGNSIKFTPAQRTRFLTEIRNAAVYCDEPVSNGSGGQEPRFTLNTQINGLSRLEVIDAICSTMNAMVVFTDDGIRLRQDTPSTVGIRVVTNNSVGNGEFKITGGSANSLYNFVEVKFNNPAQNYELETAVSYDQVSVNATSERRQSIVAFGCTSSAQARRKAQYILSNERSNPLTVTYVAGLDHSDLTPGDIVLVLDNDSLPYGSTDVGCRIIATPAGNQVTLDRAITFVPGARLICTRPDGLVSNREVVGVNTVNGKSTVTLGNTNSTNFSPSEDVKSIAAYVVDSTKYLYKIVMLTERSPGIYEVSATKHDVTKYAKVDAGV